jgi:outer membrane protein OmpA-like peptidoglycan-associated protein
MKFRILACLALLTACLSAQTAAVTVSATDSTGPTRRSIKDLDNKEIKLGEDEPGCKDTTILPRIPGCSIIQCDNKDTDTLEIQVGVSTDGAVQKEVMDGNSEVIYYLCPARVTLSNIVKQSDAALTKAGFKTVFNGKDDDEQPIVTSLKDTNWVQISTYMYNEYSAYILSVIDVPPDSQASSEALAEEMIKSGRVTLSGLSFDKEKFDMPAESEKVLAEVAALLVRQPDWKIRVEAHCAESTDKQANVVLSQKRASAVASWLLDHGIDKSRISIQGVGDSEPQKIELVRF